MDEVSTNIEDTDASKIIHLFPAISLEDVRQPKGDIELLIGADCCELLPNIVNQVGSLKLIKNQFGYCLRGSHHSLGSSGKLNHVVVQIYFMDGKTTQSNGLRPSENRFLKEELGIFFNVYSLRASCVPKCGDCRCGKRAPDCNNMTLQAEKELTMIKDILYHDPVQKEYTMQYPWIKDPRELPRNFLAAVSRLKSTVNRLKKLGESHSEAPTLQIDDMVNQGIPRKLNLHELETY